MDYSKLGQAAAATEDLTQDKKFERELPRAGVALLRFREYIELGRHEAANTAYKPSLKVMLVFELNHPDHLIEIDGKKVPQTITVRTNKGTTAKSGFRKLFKVMNDACGGGNTHFVQMLGKPFLGEIFHNTSGEGDKKKTFANLDKDGAYSLKAPVQVDALSNTQTPIPVAELDGDIKAFLWEPQQQDAEGNTVISDDDIKEMWESLFIEGTREVEKADGTKEEVSKNWLQETIMKNLEWEGSVTQALTQEHISIDDHATGADALAGATDAAPAGDLPNLD